MMSLALIFVISINHLVHSTKITTIDQDEGENVTLHCPQRSENINWIVSNVKEKCQNSAVQADGSLLLSNVTRANSHIYTCQDAETNQSLGSIKLNVRSVPPAVNNLTVITHSVYALVTWHLHENGGYSVEGFLLQYRIDESYSNSTSTWTVINCNSSTVKVFHLMPNSTYYFRVQAVNKLGPGPEVSVMAKTKYDPQEVQKANEQLLSIEQKSSSNIYMKVTIVAICLVVITFATLSFGISLVLFRNCGQNMHTELNCEATEEEVLELVPHITLNPSFNIDMLEYIEAEVSPTDVCERTNLVPSSNGSHRNGSVQ